MAWTCVLLSIPMHFTLPCTIEGKIRIQLKNSREERWWFYDMILWYDQKLYKHSSKKKNGYYICVYWSILCFLYIRQHWYGRWCWHMKFSLKIRYKYYWCTLFLKLRPSSYSSSSSCSSFNGGVWRSVSNIIIKHGIGRTKLRPRTSATCHHHTSTHLTTD